MTNVSRWDKCQLIKVKKGGVQRWLIISQLFNFFPTCRCFLAKEKEALGVWWEKQSDVPVKKKKNDISEYKEVVHSNLSSKKCRKTLERPWEHMFKWVIHETFHNRNGCQTIKYASVSYLFFFFFFERALLHSGVFALRVILVHSPTFNTCHREMQMPKEHNGCLPV